MIAAIPKLVGVHAWIVKFINWGYPRWFSVAVGSLELLGGALLLIPKLARYGVIVLAVIMIGAGYTHLANGEGLQVLRPAIFLTLLGTVFGSGSQIGKRSIHETNLHLARFLANWTLCHLVHVRCC